MKNFTKQITNKTLFKPTRWLLMALMLLLGTSSAWGGGFWNDNAWNIKFYSPDKNKDMWINDNYDSGHGASATIDLGTFTSAPYLKGYWAKTWGYGNNTDRYVKITFNNTTTSKDVSKQWDSNGDQMWKSESLNIIFPDTEGSHEESITFAINGAESITCKIKYIIEPACASCCDTYVVAGNYNYINDSKWCNGEDWDSNSDKNEMSCSDNVYTITFNNLPAKDGYQFKVVKKGDWDTAYPNNNYEFDLDATSNVTITFNSSTKAVSHSTTPSCTTPTFTISGSDQICEGTNGHEYTIANPAVASGVTYAWSNNLAGVSSASTTGTTYTFNTSANGAKTGTITVTATNGTCTHTETKNISQIAKPTAGNLSITSANLKIGDTKTITVTGANGGDKSWSSSDTNVATVNSSGVVTAKAAGTATITYTVQPSLNGCGTAATASATITVCANIANITATPQHIIKCGDTFTQKGQITIDKVDGLAYTCKRGNTPIAVPDDGIITELETAGDYTITATNICGGTASTSVIISETQNKVEISDISGSQYLCAGTANNQFSIEAINDATYSWSITGEGLVVAEGGSTNTVSVTAGALPSQVDGTLTITVTKNDCETSKSKDISLIPLPTLTSISPTAGTFCATQTVADLQATITFAPELGDNTVAWKDGTGNSVTSSANLSSGVYTAQIKSANGGCLGGAQTYSVSIKPDPIVRFISGNTTICEGQTTTITMRAANTTAYHIYKNDVEIAVIENNTGEIQYEVSEGGTYYFKASNGCVESNSSNSAIIVVNTPPAIGAIQGAEYLCNGKETYDQLYMVNEVEGAEYEWTLTGITDYALVSPVSYEGTNRKNYAGIVTYNNANQQETGTLTVVATKAGCSAIATKELTRYVTSVTKPTISLSTNDVICTGSDITLTASANNAESYEWTLPTGITKKSGDGAEITVTVGNAYAGGVITVTASNTCGSATSDDLVLTVAPVPTISIKIRDLNESSLEVMCYELVTLYATTSNTVDGALVYWYQNGNQIIENGQPVTGDSYTFTREDPVTLSNITAKVQNGTSCPAVESNEVNVTFTAHDECDPSYVQGKILYFKPGGWNTGSHISYKVNFHLGGNSYSKYDLKDEDSDGVYAIEIPSNAQTFQFLRMEGSTEHNYSSAVDVSKVLDAQGKTQVFTASAPNGQAWNGRTPTNTDLDSGKTFRTIAVNGNGLWNKGAESVFAHPWSSSNSNDDNWSRMIPSLESGIWLVDISTEFTDIVFERRNADGTYMDNRADKHKTADLKLDIYGNEFKITEYGHNDGASKANGEWHWKWFESDYELGVQTDVVQQNGVNLEIYCKGVVYKTSCAPGIKYGFEYSTNQDMTDATYEEYAQGAIVPGASFEEYIPVAAGTYYVRARAQYESGTIYYGLTKQVTIANNCDPDYEFAVGSTSVVVQACGGSRVLPAVEIISDINPEDTEAVWSYEWTNEDGSTATNLSKNNIASPTFNGTASQTYKLRVFKTVDDEIKCTQTAEYNVVYNDNSPKAVITLNDAEVASLTVDVNEGIALAGAIHNSESYTWSVTENSQDVTSTMLNQTTTLTPTFNTKEAGTYVVTLTAAQNQDCVAHTTTVTITVTAPTEDCASGDIEVEYDFTNENEQSRTPNFFNGWNDVYYSYKLNGDDCVYTSTDDSKNHLYKNSPSFIISCDELTETHFPITLYIIGQSDWGSPSARGYAEFSIEYSKIGKKIIVNATGGNNDYSTTDAICIANATRKATTTTITYGDISTSTSAPIVTTPKATVQGKELNAATLSAYFAATGCADITSYGFEYIQSDNEPADWTDATKVVVGTSTPTLGKSFTANLTELTEGTYWFRAYAINSSGTGYSAVSSFFIIGEGAYPMLDCNQVSITAANKVQVVISNVGNEAVLQGSYQVGMVNQGAVMPITPTPVPEIAVEGNTTITSTTTVDPNNHHVTVTLTYKGRTHSCSISACTPQEGGKGDTIYYTIDASAVTDECMLVFPTVHEAIDHLKASTGDDGFVTKSDEGYMLRQPVVMQVVYSTKPYVGNIEVSNTGGDATAYIIPITNINNDGNDGDGSYHPLIIRAANPNAKPALQHVAIRKSRNVVLDQLNIVSSDEDIDNAIDIDNNNNNWVGNTIGRFANANVTVKNCLIKSKGFTCMHVSAVTKVYFINNEILADLSDDEIDDPNTRQWGASAKFIRCKDILFLRNNFTGTHATSVWLQGVEGALLMNNVFWNNNQISTGKTAMVRIVQQSSPEQPKNIGIYYNTMYLADCDRGADPKFDFLRLNSDEAGDIKHNGDFEISSIEFMYNNCYSYDDKTPGKSTSPFKGRDPWAGLCHNNFWSVYDENKGNASSDFAFNGCAAAVGFVNVQENVCTTTAANPNSLVIRGTELNTGIQPNTALAIELGANQIISDRTREDVRPTTPTIIDPDDVPSGVVDAGGEAPAIALVVSNDETTMTHTIDVKTYIGTTAGFTYDADLLAGEDFILNNNQAGTVTVTFDATNKTQNVTYSDKLHIYYKTDDAADDEVAEVIIPITGKYVTSYTGGWTLGAYQQTESIATDSIIWQGTVSSDWDDRNNWIDAKTKTTLTCVNTLASNLKVIIPAPHSENYPAPDEQGIVTYPKLPAFNSNSRDDDYGVEIVNAGQGVNNEPTQFADHIYMEYGAALLGVENLVDGEVSRYNEATTHLTVDRSKWILVGNMVKPFTNVNKTETRLTLSGDYYIARQEPNVYMHQVKIEDDEPTWLETFEHLDVTVNEQEAFAIQIPNQYGKYKFSDEIYYTYISPNPAKIKDGSVEKSFTFNGRFINEDTPLTFTGLSTTTKLMVNNTYPCNLSASAIQDAGYTVWLYDYDMYSFVNPALAGSSKIKPQHGFVLLQTTGSASLEVTDAMLANGSTRYNDKSVAVTMPYHVIELYNANSTDGYASQIQLLYDADKGSASLDVRDAEKLWSNSSMVPDLYMMMYDATLQRLYVEKPEKVIPLGVRLQQNMDVTFKMTMTNGIEQAILEDRHTGKQYDLTGNKEATITGLEAGNIEGRFYLNLVVDAIENILPTDIADAFIEPANINIYVNSGNNLSVMANNAELQTIYVSDMSGRTQRYDVSGSYANITLPVSQGVYVVQVISDNVVRSEKVIVK